MSIKLPIKDIRKIHNGYDLTLNSGLTVLVGPNGAGKTTLLGQLAEYAKENQIPYFMYSNFSDGGHFAMDRYLQVGDVARFSAAMWSSEGEQVALNFGAQLVEMGSKTRKAVEEGKDILLLIDAVDSGASIDRVRELRNVFSLMSKDANVYIVAAANQYEMVRDGTDCVDVRTGEHLKFHSYDDYADFICSYLKKQKAKKSEKK